MNLARMYDDGLGVEQNANLAKRYYMLAAVKDDDDIGKEAKKQLEMIQEKEGRAEASKSSEEVTFEKEGEMKMSSDEKKSGKERIWNCWVM